MGYYDISKLLTYNRFLNIVIGQRGGGKTYQAKKLGIKNFINKGEKFIYLRRNKSDIKFKGKIEKFFDDMHDVFPEHELKVEPSGSFKIDNKTCGYYVALSTAQNYKSTPFNDVTLIIFDEFIIDKSYMHYIPNEVINFLEFISTVVRKRSNVKVIMLSNAITVSNPYFTYFNIEYKKGSKFQKFGKQIVIEFYSDDNFAKEMYETPFGQLIKGTTYGSYAVENNFLQDTDAFIKKKTGNCLIFFNLKVDDNNIYGIWRDDANNIYYVSKDYVKNYPVNYSASTKVHNEQYELINSMNYRFRVFKNSYYNGRVFFESIKIKNEILEIFKI